MRAPKHSDFNALKNVKKSGHGTLTRSQPSFQSPTGANSAPTSTPSECSSHRDGLVTLTVHNRVPWNQSQLSRFSQHVVLSSQTLADFVRVIPCESCEMPSEVVGGQGNVVGYTYESEEQGQETTEDGCVLLIEDVAYGDGWPGIDYAEYVRSLQPKV